MSHLTKAIVKMLFRAFQWVCSLILKIQHGGPPKFIPTMKNSVLMESACSLAEKIRNQKVSSVEVVSCYADRIQEINGVLNCVVEVRKEEALKEAKKADALIRSGVKTIAQLKREFPFLGVPFTAPESLAIAGFLHTSGDPDRKDQKAEKNDEAVALMISGGAIPLACTNVSERCFGFETLNPTFGMTLNPYDTNRSPGGPFGGEAALVASSGSPLGLTYRSRLPSAFNGVFSHDPTGRQVPGPTSRNAADLLPALQLLTRDTNSDLKLEEPVDLSRLKFFFVEEEIEKADEELRKAMRKAKEHFRNVCKASVEQISLKLLEKQTNIAMASGKENEEEEINLGKEMRKAMVGKSRHSFFYLLGLLEHKVFSRHQVNPKKIENDLNKVQGLLGSDGVLISPSHPTSAFYHGGSIAGVGGGALEGLALPTTYCPAGFDSRSLPLGVRVTAPANKDRFALAVARELEKLLGGWRPPPTQGTFTLKNAAFRSYSNEKVKTL